jgi:hypothetical protein
MSDCQTCRLEPFCFYPHKPCDCVGLRKFWDEARRKEWDQQQEQQQPSQGKRDE